MARWLDRRGLRRQQVQVGGGIGVAKNGPLEGLGDPLAGAGARPMGNRAARAWFGMRLEGWACATGHGAAGAQIPARRAALTEGHASSFERFLFSPALILTPACPNNHITTTGRMAFAASRMLRRGLTANKNLVQRVAAPQAGICKWTGQGQRGRDDGVRHTYGVPGPIDRPHQFIHTHATPQHNTTPQPSAGCRRWRRAP